MERLDLIGQAYADESLPFANQEAINWFPEITEDGGARNVKAMKGSPGLLAFAQVGTGSIRGAVTMAGTLYVVADTMLYSLTADGTATALGSVDGSGRVGITENGYQVVVVNGRQGYTYNRNTATFAEITDPAFQPADTCTFQDQYVIFNAAGTQQFFISAIGDATTFDALDFASAETTTGTLKAVISSHRELWLFKTDGVEVWTDTGDAEFPFERTGAVIQKGIASSYCVSQLDNTLYWLSNDGYVYRASGYSPVRISTRPIEQAIAKETLTEAFSFAYEENGHAFFCLTFPSGKTWVYDAATNMWHRRKSYGRERWQANCYAFAYGKHFIGAVDSGKVFELRRDVFAEGTDPLISERKTQFVSADENYLYGNGLELTFNTGEADQNGQGSDPIVELRYSDDSGRNWSNWKQRHLGKIGKYANRVRFHGMGRFRSRLFHLRVSDPARRDLIAAQAGAA